MVTGVQTCALPICVKVFSKELSSMTEKEKEDYRYSKISFVFQDFCSKEEETLEENLMKILDIQSLSQDEKQRKIDFLLSLVGLKNKKKIITLQGNVILLIQNSVSVKESAQKAS